MTVAEEQIPDEVDNLVCLIDGGSVVATTPRSELSEAFLLLNVDRYRTGTRQTDLGTFPDVLTGLNEVEFVVKRFPQSVKEKLLLVVILRFIEHRALTNDSGELPNSAKESRRSRGDERGVSPLVGRVYTPEGGNGHVALVALEVGRNVWRSLWTYDGDRSERVRAYVRQNF